MMILYEIKKVLRTRGSKFALVLLAAAVVLCAWTATHNWDTKWVDEQGEETAGFSAVRKLRSARKEWAGPLDIDHLTAVIQENQRILASPEYNSSIIQQRDIAYGWRQGIADIRFLIGYFFDETFGDYEYYRADSVQTVELPGFYERRTSLLKEWLTDETGPAANRFTEAEQQWLIEQYQALKTPMYYDYYEGWEQANEQVSDLIFYCTVLLGFLCAGIFPNEFKWKADAIYFSSRNGRQSASQAKILAGFAVVTVLYWVAIMLYSLFVLAFLGFDGWNCPIQLEQWKSFYNITMMERYLLNILGGYLGNLFFAVLMMWISVKTRTSLLAVTVPFILTFLPNFILQYMKGTPLAKILGLLPDRLLQIDNILEYFDLYSIGNLVVPAVPILFVLYSIPTALLIPAIYREFTRTEVI